MHVYAWVPREVEAGYIGSNNKTGKRSGSSSRFFTPEMNRMASALVLPASDRSEAPSLSRFLKRVVNALALSRINAVERELRLHEPRLRKAAEARGESFSFHFDRAALLPFQL